MKNEKDKIDIRVVSLTRFTNKKLLKGKKANICVCGPNNYGFSVQVKCKECGNVCFYTNDNLDMKKKNIKKICVKCALGVYRKKLDDEVIKILENVYIRGVKNGC